MTFRLLAFPADARLTSALGRSLALAAALVAALALPGAAGAQSKRLNVYNWSDYVGETTIADFQKATGIKVNYDVFDSNETLEAKLLAGKTGYDVVVPSGNFLARQIKAGMFRKLDKAKLPNLVNLDPEILAVVAQYDPGNDYAVPYFWGTNGIGYNVAKVKELAPDAPTGSWDLIFKPENARRLAKCGIAMLDSQSEVMPIALHYLGRDPHSAAKADVDAAVALLKSIRPHIRYFHSSKYINDLASGAICVALGFSGDVLQAKSRAEEAAKKAKGRKPVEIAYAIPREGTVIWFDNFAIPADARNVAEAHAFIDTMLKPDVIAAASNFVRYANANKASYGLVDPALRADPNVFPPDELRKRLFLNRVAAAEVDRMKGRAWAEAKKRK